MMAATTVKRLIAALQDLPADAIVLIPGERYARPLTLCCNALMEVSARPVRRSRVIARRHRSPSDRRPEKYRVRFTDYELRRYGHGKGRGLTSKFPVHAVYLNVLDE